MIPSGNRARCSTLADLAGGLNNGTLIFELAKLAEAPRAAIVVEDRYGNP